MHIQDIGEANGGTRAHWPVVLDLAMNRLLRELRAQNLPITEVGLVPFPGGPQGNFGIGISTHDASSVDTIRFAAFEIVKGQNVGPVNVYGPGRDYPSPVYIPGSARR
jgi:hypothetical protein